MSLNSGRLLSLLAFALASLIATTSVGAAGPAALVESVLTNSVSTEVMSYAETGKTFKLRPQDGMVLSYMNSCVRETITGGTVTIGIDHSTVQGGTVSRTNLDCGSNGFVLTSSTTEFAGRVFRGLSPAR